MSSPKFAKLPDTACYAVIFSSQRTQADNGYAETADRMEELIATMPGYLGAESVRGADGFGITVAYFDTEESILAWRNHAEHTDARRRGREEWYSHFEVRIAKVERAYGFPR
ncbi:antibiotic biosynthesis monooxygenase [Agrobacterium rhizogenes]|uniref:antibiotic biosynthesis monooxygenase family protein n=1 Tax=Rhizobium rhizogenes TaxID=359 RepID=UPI001573C27C|nr:antibiotic biosynthesis monooxygenase [Rhizobium rhizogenes]NTG46964.1 antibiotic biosynthesis monooxygenase [Rhizobium rhizogenes]